MNNIMPNIEDREYLYGTEYPAALKEMLNPNPFYLQRIKDLQRSTPVVKDKVCNKTCKTCAYFRTEHCSKRKVKSKYKGCEKYVKNK